MNESPPRLPGRLHAGQPIVFHDQRRREYYDQLREGGVSNVRGDRVPHDLIIGGADGLHVESPRGKHYRVFSATMVQHALNMQRHATIIYPKDIGVLLVWGDVFAGATVVEGGFGSGALSTALLRAIGPTGRLITYELRPEAANRARKNVAALLGETPNHEVRIGDVYAGIDATGVDRVFLDVPEPWQALDAAAAALRDGGMLAAYVPTTLQMQTFVLAAKGHPAFATTECLEVLLRGWYVTHESVRPDQQMVGHTGFLAFSRRAARPIGFEARPMLEDEAPPREGEGEGEGESEGEPEG